MIPNGNHAYTVHVGTEMRNARTLNDARVNRHLFFLFHSRDYYKLSLCVIFSNIFDNLWQS